MPPDDKLAPIPDPGRGKVKVKNVVYRLANGDVRKWNGRTFVHTGPVPQSKHKGVSWNSAGSNWVGTVYDLTAPRYASGAPKQLHTKYFDDEDECFEALTALKAQVAAQTAQTLHAMAQELDATRDLPPRPANETDAAPNTAYYGQDHFRAKGAAAKEFRPVRYVRGKVGEEFLFRACCQHGIGPKDACTQVAKPIVNKGEAIFCKMHGGGPRCPGGPTEVGGCPCASSVQPHESDDRVAYVKDGTQYCCRCFCKEWPDDVLSRNAKAHMHAKEQAVREFLEARFGASHPSLKWVMDRAVKGTRRRPDFRPLTHLLGVKSHDLVIELDENSHWLYECADERDKEADVHYWLNSKTKPLFFVRMNPDAYDDPVTGERVTSCWGKGPYGLPRVKPSKEAEWAQRLEKLAQVIKVYLVDCTGVWASWAEADRPPPELHAIELFYDNVKVKKNGATTAFDAIKAAAKKRKRETKA